MTDNRIRTNAYTSIALILTMGSSLFGGENSENRLVAAGKNVWNSAFCRSSRTAIANNPKTALATGIGTGVLLAGAPVTGGIMATTALALNTSNDLSPVLNRVMESADHGRAQLNAELRETLHTGLQDFQNIGTAITEQVGLSADRAIHALGQAGNDVTYQIGESTSRIVETAGLAIQGNIVQLGTAGEQLVNSLNNAAQDIGIEGRRSTQFFFKTLWQTLGFGSLGLAGATLFYKSITNPNGEKSGIFASIGAGITIASIVISKLVFDQNLAAENEYTQMRNAMRETERARAHLANQQLREMIQTQQQNRNREQLRKNAEQIIQQKPSTDADVQRMCIYVQSTISNIEKLATGLATKKTLKPEERDQALCQISFSAKATKAKIKLAETQFEKRIRRAFKQTKARIENQIANTQDTDAITILRQALAREKAKTRQLYKHNARIIKQQLEQLRLTKQLIHKQLGITNKEEGSSPVAARSCD